MDSLFSVHTSHWTSELWVALPGHLLLFVYAFLFAMAEIEIEGDKGWAENLPTWYRVQPWYARLFRFMMANKPLTGYHAVMLPLTFVSFHLGFAFGLPWTGAAELTILARFFFWIIVWDVLWFIYNPAFGWHRFRPGNVWWLGKRWLGPFPQEYWSGTLASFVLLAPIALGTTSALVQHAWFCVVLTGLTVFSALGVRPYHRWYAHMRRPGRDERHLAIPQPDVPRAKNAL